MTLFEPDKRGSKPPKRLTCAVCLRRDPYEVIEAVGSLDYTDVAMHAPSIALASKCRATPEVTSQRRGGRSGHTMYDGVVGGFSMPRHRRGRPFLLRDPRVSLQPYTGLSYVQSREAVGNISCLQTHQPHPDPDAPWLNPIVMHFHGVMGSHSLKISRWAVCVCVCVCVCLCVRACVCVCIYPRPDVIERVK